MKRKSVPPRFRSFTLNSLCIGSLLLGAILAYGQGVGGRAPQPQPTPAAPPSTMDETQMILGNRNRLGSSAPASSSHDSNCFLPPLTGMQTGTVEVADLQVPAKAQKDYDDGCEAVKNKKLAEAETHLRKVVKEYAKYAAAWVLLGQVLEAKQKTDEARDACSHPLTALPNYLPAYLCLTDISARLNRWDEVLKFSGRALEIDPTANAAAYAYNATAALNFHHLNDAEKSALRALEIDSNHSDPRLHYLLAQVYAAKGDLANATAQLREYLKVASDPDDAAVVKNYLAKLEGQSGK